MKLNDTILNYQNFTKAKFAAGTGKTFIYNTLIASIRGREEIAAK